jgi:Kdo2-lipid IVA lauroyltransferase/acyltransferase
MTTTPTNSVSDAPRAAPPTAWWLRAVGSLSFPVLHGLAGTVAWLVRVVVRFRLRTVRANLRRCFPTMSAAQLAATVRTHYRDMTVTGLELTKLATLSATELCERVRFIDAAKLHAELAAGRKVMLLGAHQGNWEWLLQRLAVEFAPRFVCAYKPLRSARFDRDFLNLRSRFGATMVPAKGMLRALLRKREAHVTAMAADQMPHSSPSRVWLPFLGQTTAFYPGPAEIASRYGYAAWYMVMNCRAPGYYDVEFIPIAAADARLAANLFTTRYAECLAARLRRVPSDWAWGHRRWKLESPTDIKT